jgi:hypothetical protein
VIPLAARVVVRTRGRVPAPHRKQLIIVGAIAAAGVGWLAASLPPEGFYSGDSGLKLIAARSAIEHPTRPLEVDLPTSGGKPMPYVDPMVALHDGHGDILQSPLFPLISAPAIAAFGLRGAYLLPAMAFVAMLPLLDVIRREAAPDSSFPLLAWTAVAANPLFFYSLEFWEHSVAVAFLAAGLGAALVGWRCPRGGWRVASGALAGFAALLRPEAVWRSLSRILSTAGHFSALTRPPISLRSHTTTLQRDGSDSMSGFGRIHCSRSGHCFLSLLPGSARCCMLS